MRQGIAALLALFFQTGCMMSFSEVSTSLRVKDVKRANVRRMDEPAPLAKAHADACKLRRDQDGALVETWHGHDRYVVRGDGVVLPEGKNLRDELVPWGPISHPPPWKDHTLYAAFCGCVQMCAPMVVVAPEDNVKEIRQKSKPVYFGGAALVAGGIGLSLIGSMMLFNAGSPTGPGRFHGAEFYAVDFPLFIVGAAMAAGGLSVLLTRPREDIVYSAPDQ